MHQVRWKPQKTFQTIRRHFLSVSKTKEKLKQKSKSNVISMEIWKIDTENYQIPDI